MQLSDVDLVVFYEKPHLKLRRQLATFIRHAPRGYGQFRRIVPTWSLGGARIRGELNRASGARYEGPWGFTLHHQAHAASAYYPSPFDKAAILTLDAVGEWTTTSISHGSDNDLRMLAEQRFPHSLGLLYSTMTAFTGFRVNSGEYKLMGLAPYGDPIYVDRLLDKVIDLQEDGSFCLDMKFFAFSRSDVMWTRHFERLLGGAPRDPTLPPTRRDMDLAASVQHVTEEVVLRTARHARRLTGSKNLVLAGGVALNGVANGLVLRSGLFERVWVPPAPGDSGGAIGCALYAWHHVLGHAKPSGRGDRLRGGFLGPRFERGDIQRYLESVDARFHRIPTEAALCDCVADMIAAGKIVAHFSGPMEFGPRALGNRSILADPRDPDMQRKLNLRVKLRESFRPFAPAVMRDRVSDYFVVPEGFDSPYMGFVTFVRPGTPRVPAVTHVDGSARVQVVDPITHARLHRILDSFERLTGCPMVVNTSLNVRGEPIACTPAEAYHCLMSTEIDALVLEDVVILREEQKGGRSWSKRAAPD